MLGLKLIHVVKGATGKIGPLLDDQDHMAFAVICEERNICNK